MNWYLMYVLLAASQCANNPLTHNDMSWTDKPIHADVRISIERDQMRVELTLDNPSGADVFVPDVVFLPLKEKVKLNPNYLLLVVNGDNTLEASLFVQPLDPTTQWASPPTFFTHIVRARTRYQRHWELPYPVRIQSRDNHGMARTVPVSTDFIFNLGIVQPPSSYKPKEVEFDGQTLYEFGQEALRFQTKQQIVLRNRAISMRIED